MGPLAGIGDPVFWFTVRPILGALGASLAMTGNIVGPLLFFIGWNAIRMAFLWYTQEFGYKAGSEITKDMSNWYLTRYYKRCFYPWYVHPCCTCSTLGFYYFSVNLPAKQLSEGGYIVFPEGTVTGTELKGILVKL